MVGASFPLCVVCNKQVNFHQHALCCDSCTRWQHRLCDSGVTYKDYNCLTKGETEIEWHCAACHAANSGQDPQVLAKVFHSKMSTPVRKSERQAKPTEKFKEYLYGIDEYEVTGHTETSKENPIKSDKTSHSVVKRRRNINLISKAENKVALNELPAGWKKSERKSVRPNGIQNLYYISPNGRKFCSKKQALEFCKLHYQGVSPLTSAEDKTDSHSFITNLERNKTYSENTSTEGNDENIQPFIRLHKLKYSSDNISDFQPYVHLERLSPFTILRETNQTKPYVQIERISDISRREFNVKYEERQLKKENINCKNIFMKDDNNNKISKIKKKQQKFDTYKVKRHTKNGVKKLKTNKNKSPMRVKAQWKKHSMNISIKINRKYLQILPNNKFRLNDDQSFNQNSSEKRWNLKLGNVKVKNKDKIIKNSTLKNMESCYDGSECEKYVGKNINSPHSLITLAENAKLHTTHGRQLIWLHISPKDIEFGLIS